MQFWPKFGMSKKEHLNLTFLSMPSATWKPEIFVTMFLGRRILDKKLMDHNFGQNLVCRRRNISDNLTFLLMPSTTWKLVIRAIL